MDKDGAGAGGKVVADRVRLDKTAAMEGNHVHDDKDATRTSAEGATGQAHSGKSPKKRRKVNHGMQSLHIPLKVAAVMCLGCEGARGHSICPQARGSPQNAIGNLLSSPPGTHRRGESYWNGGLTLTAACRNSLRLLQTICKSCPTSPARWRIAGANEDHGSIEDRPKSPSAISLVCTWLIRLLLFIALQHMTCDLVRTYETIAGEDRPTSCAWQHAPAGAAVSHQPSAILCTVHNLTPWIGETVHAMH